MSVKWPHCFVKDFILRPLCLAFSLCFWGVELCHVIMSTVISNIISTGLTPMGCIFYCILIGSNKDHSHPPTHCFRGIKICQENILSNYDVGLVNRLITNLHRQFSIDSHVLDKVIIICWTRVCIWLHCIRFLMHSV